MLTKRKLDNAIMSHRGRNTQEVHMVEIDQNKNMSVRDLDSRKEGRVRLEPNDELQKIQIGVIAEK